MKILKVNVNQRYCNFGKKPRTRGPIGTDRGRVDRKKGEILTRRRQKCRPERRGRCDR